MPQGTIRWRNNRVELIDQRLLPGKTRYVACTTDKDIRDAIKMMKIRGAPAIGIAGAYGAYLGVRKSRAAGFRKFKLELEGTIKRLAASRPTARNLFWALERVNALVDENKARPVRELKRLILEAANAILEEDGKICRSMGQHGKRLIAKGARVLTHCNAGGLATGGYGTALGVIMAAGKKIRRVYVDETRPRLQGARLTMWELMAAGIPAVLICDNMAASLMAKAEIDAVIVGADRIAANGDTANKIGTYNLGVLARYHKVPFYVAAPFSTFDLSTADGAAIPIEERSAMEVKKVNGKYITPRSADVKNPAFDVTPAGLISAIITERGIIKKPDKRKITKMIGPIFSMRDRKS
ncbi:MAG: S-methyl-5-thioribose-1-phosphate isomerase [Candidatus Makaraimicrobium thalassicum]|nr:MAG: S-methyl-5-thioribose-1-phosphate isomerase [Candidatus Omnitrophota bacterium]